MSNRLDIHSFREQHADWLTRFPDSPLYGLPEKSIDRLAKPSVRRAALLDGPAVRAEQHLYRLCQQADAVGFDGRRAITYPYLTQTLSLPEQNQFRHLGWSEKDWKSAKALLPKVSKANERLAAYVGWLLTETPFRNALQDLSRRWRELPEDLRPGFPLLRPTVVRVTEAPEGYSEAPDAIRAWVMNFREFCDQWSLIGMATWELPFPQGPLLPAFLPSDSPALSKRMVHLILPIHYHLTGDEDLINTIVEQQRALAIQFGFDPSVAGLPYYIQYARMFKVVHNEGVIRQRYAPEIKSRCAVGALIEAIAEGTSQSVEQVKRLRKIISQCQKGRRSQVERLRPPKH